MPKADEDTMVVWYVLCRRPALEDSPLHFTSSRAGRVACDLAGGGGASYCEWVAPSPLTAACLFEGLARIIKLVMSEMNTERAACTMFITRHSAFHLTSVAIYIYEDNGAILLLFYS